ncbi:MAG: efflux RND transporter permease subunit [Acidobacteriota bacterium]
MNIVDFSLKRRVTIAMAALAISLFGLVAFSRLPIDLLPDLSYPTVTVETRFPGAAPAEVESLVTRPIEEAVGVVAGVERLTSVSKPGLSQVTLEFGWNRDMDFAALDVRQKLDLITLPRTISKPVLLRFDPANDPIMRLYVTGGQDLYQLRYVAEEVIKKDLESTAGLAAVKVGGGFEEEIQVEIDQGKLALVGLSLDAVRDRLARENVNQAGGSLYEQEARYLVRSRNEFEDLDDLRETVLFSEGGRQVTLADVATVVRGHKQREVITRFGSDEAVELALYKEGDANTVAVARAIDERLASIESELPESVSIAIGSNQSTFIQSSIEEVLSNALIGGLIAIVVLLLFLKDARSTLIIAVSIPLSIVATFFLMFRTGTTLNIMSLGGLALGVGMLVDNAIVVLEAIYKHRENGESAMNAARKGASEVGTAVAASTLTTVAVFLPVVFLEGVAAQLFRDQAITVSFSLIASLAVALTLIPMLAGVLLAASERMAERPTAPEGKAAKAWWALVTALPALLIGLVRRLFEALWWVAVRVTKPLGAIFDSGLGVIQNLYPRMLRWSLRNRILVVATSIIMLIGTASIVPSLGLDLIPPLSQGSFAFKVELPAGTPLEITDRVLANAAAEVADDERIAAVSSIAGGAGLTLTATGAEGENVGRVQVQMADGTTPDDEAAVTADLRKALAKERDMRISLERPAVFTVRTPVEVELYGDDLIEIADAADAVAETIEDIPGLVDVESTAELGNPELEVRFDRAQLARLGLDLGQVTDVVRGKVQGDVATRFTEGDREIDIVVRSLTPGSASVEDIGNLIIGHRSVGGTRSIQERTESGILVSREVAAGPGENVPIRLETVADVQVTRGPSEIRRIGQQRVAVVQADVVDRDMGAVATDIQTRLAETALPLGVVPELGGQQEEMMRSLRMLLMAMGLAIFLVYLVMASQFESFRHPFVIIFTLPLGAVGVIGALALTGTTVNVVALIGADMHAGIVVNNAIVLIDAVNKNRRDQGMDMTTALIEGGKSRLRPILMTSATTIFGLLPMALGFGEGAELRAPLAITVIGGLAVATLLTLVVIPIVYSLIDRDTVKLPASDEVGDEPIPNGASAASAAS